MRAELHAAGHAADARFALEVGAVDEGLVRGILPLKKPFPACFVARGPEVVGFVWLQAAQIPPRAKILEVFITPHARRAGVGRELVLTAIAAAEAAGYPDIEVGTLARDGRAIAFWRSVGFGDWWVTLRREPAILPPSEGR